jgi:hypothetical protein
MRRISSRQNVEVNTGSRSDTMDCGTPHAMEAYNVSEEGLRYGFCSIRVSQRDEVAVLAEAVDHRQYHRLPPTHSRASTKSRPMLIQMAYGTGRGMRRRGG